MNEAFSGPGGPAEAPHSQRPNPHTPRGLADELAGALARVMQMNAGGFLTRITFKRPNPHTGSMEEVTTCVSQQLENISIALAMNTASQAKLIALLEMQNNATADLIEAIDENTRASAPEEDEAQEAPQPRRRRKTA